MDYKDTAEELLSYIRKALFHNDLDLALALLITNLEKANIEGKGEMINELNKNENDRP